MEFGLLSRVTGDPHRLLSIIQLLEDCTDVSQSMFTMTSSTYFAQNCGNHFSLDALNS